MQPIEPTTEERGVLESIAKHHDFIINVISDNAIELKKGLSGKTLRTFDNWRGLIMDLQRRLGDVYTNEDNFLYNLLNPEPEEEE